MKTAVTELEQTCLRREYRCYEHPEIRGCPYIRELYDTVGFDAAGSDATRGLPTPASLDNPPCLMFEWMDTPLADLPSQPYRATRLPQQISRAVLSALLPLKGLNACHTGAHLSLPTYCPLVLPSL